MNSSLLVSESVFIEVSPEESIYESPVKKTANFDSMTREEAMRLLNLAATLLQVNIKMFLQRKKYKRQLLSHKSAVKIQAMWRGYSVRNLNMALAQKFRYEMAIKTLQYQIHSISMKHEHSVHELIRNQTAMADVIKTLTSEVESLKCALVEAKSTPETVLNRTYEIESEVESDLNTESSATLKAESAKDIAIVEQSQQPIEQDNKDAIENNDTKEPSDMETASVIKQSFTKNTEILDEEIVSSPKKVDIYNVQTYLYNLEINSDANS